MANVYSHAVDASGLPRFGGTHSQALFRRGDSTLRIYQLKGKTQVRITDRRAKRKLGLTDVPELRKPALYVGYGPGLVHSDEG